MLSIISSDTVELIFLNTCSHQVLFQNRFLSIPPFHYELKNVAKRHLRGSCPPASFFFLLNLFSFGCAGSSLLRGLFSSCQEWGLLFIAVHRLLIVGASPILEYRLSCSQACRIFPDQGSNLCSLHWQMHSKPMDHQRSPCFSFLKMSSTYVSTVIQLPGSEIPPNVQLKFFLF